MRSLGTLALTLALAGVATPAAADELTARDVRKVMDRHAGEVKACYLRHGITQKSSTGQVTVGVVVDRSGDPRDVSVDAPGVKGKRLTRCIATAVGGWTFPSIDSATEVQLPFLFHHARAGTAGPRPSARRAHR
jgi:hypothetical protein